MLKAAPPELVDTVGFADPPWCEAKRGGTGSRSRPMGTAGGVGLPGGPAERRPAGGCGRAGTATEMHLLFLIIMSQHQEILPGGCVLGALRLLQGVKNQSWGFAALRSHLQEEGQRGIAEQPGPLPSLRLNTRSTTHLS